MDERICWQAGDERKCKACGAWHRTYVAHPDEPKYLMNIELRYTCPQDEPGGFRYAGRIGEPVHEPYRWRRSVRTAVSET